MVARRVRPAGPVAAHDPRADWVRLDRRDGPVARAVVDDDELEAVAWERLGGQRIEHRRDAGQRIARGYDDGDERCRHGRPMLFGRPRAAVTSPNRGRGTS